MNPSAIDLRSGRASVVGNYDDRHTFRLSNPVDGPVLVAPNNEYEADFVSSSGVTSLVSLDVSLLAQGVLEVPVTIRNGVYNVRRVSPRRTLLTLEVKAL